MTSQQDKAKRIDTLMNLKAQGHSYNKLVAVATKAWGVSPRQAKRYLRDVAQMERDLVSIDTGDFWGATMNQLERLRAKALQDGKPELALRIKAEQRKARDQYIKERKGTLHASSNDPDNIDPSTIDALLAAIEADEPAS